MTPDTIVGIVLMMSGDLFPTMLARRPAWAPPATLDVQTAGAIMWVGGDALMFILILCVFIAFLRDKRAHGTMGTWLEGARTHALSEAVELAGVAAPDRPGQRRGQTVDDDEHLAAYNEYLARLNQSTPVTPIPKRKA